MASAILSPTPNETTRADFHTWTTCYLAAPPADRPALLAKGRALAWARRADFLSAILHDPRRALQEAVPPRVRQELPAEIVALLEERVNTRGSLATYLSTQGVALRCAKTDGGREFEAHTFGRDEFAVTEQPGRSLIGVALPDENGKLHLALSDSRVRRLEPGERPNPALERIRACPVSGKAITDETPAVEANGQIVYLCDGAHTAAYDEQLILAEGSTGGPQRVSGAFPHSTGRSIGVLRILFVPMTFLDQNAAPASEATCYALMSEVADFYSRQSFGKLTVQTTVAPPVRLPRTEAYYIAKDLEVNGLTLEHTDAMNEARAFGYDSGDYDCAVVRLNGGPRAVGGWGGGGRVWTYSDDPKIVAHEIGHTLGLAHANSWNTSGTSTIGGGASQEYGDVWDVMGLGLLPSGHYNIWAKGFVNWLPADQLWDVKQSGTYRIYAHDVNTLEPVRRYGLKVTKDIARTYYIEARQLRDDDANNPWLKYGAILEWRWPAKAGNNLLLDTTPGSLFGKEDGGLVLGRTFSDRETGLHFTPVAVNFGTQKSIDLVVNVGHFSGNSAPVLALSASTINVAVNATVTIDATATDADGDALAYFWETGERQVYANSAQFTRTFTTAGKYWIACTASDMKGGATMRYAIVNVGAHAQFSIGGRVTFGGVGLPDVLVKTSARQACTDADGFYTLAGLDAGTQMMTVAREGCTFTGTSSFVVGPDVANANFTAAEGTLLSIAAPLPMAAEGGAPGRFTLTRTGSLGTPLTVKVQTISGTATKGTDYTLTPDVSANTFTIPAGQSSWNIDLAPLDDTSAEGPEIATIQLVPDAAYVISGIGEATVTIDDNDTSLPLVSIAATLAHTVEGDHAPAQFTITRAGTSGAVTVNYTISGTATNGVDYAALPGSITLPSGATSADISITTINDALNEGSETVTITLASNAAYLIGANAATITIADDDQQIIGVTATDADVTELGNPGAFLVTRTGDTSQPLTVYYSLAGTALHGVDFEILPGSITIPAGETSAAVNILPIADGIGEGAETVQMLLASVGTNYQVGAASMATLTIADNAADPTTIEVFASQGAAREAGSAGTFRLTARGGGDAITVNFTMSGTAVEGADYETTAHTATVPAGTGTRTVDVAVVPMQDGIAEPVETVTLTLASGSGYTFWNQTGSATMWLRDETAPAIFTATYRDSPTEGAATSGFYLSRSGPFVGALEVHFTLTGTATNGADYAAIPLSATIPDGASGVDVPVVPIDDALAEGTETIILTLAPGSYSASPLPAVLYLNDNEAPALVVQFATASGSWPENAGTVNVPVVLAGTSSAPMTVEYFIGPGGNTAFGAGVDYALGGGPVGTLTFQPGETVRTIPLTIIDDAVRESGERVIIKLRNANGMSLGPLSVFTFTITDNDGGIEAWRLTHFGNDAGNPAIAGDLADPDFDGMVNLLEYAQNLDPHAASTGPVMGREPGFLTLTYRRNLAASDLDYTVQEALGFLGTNVWETPSVVEEIVSDDGMTRVIKAKVTAGAEAAHYVRLRVSRE